MMNKMNTNQNYFTANDFCVKQKNLDNLFPCPTCKDKEQLTQQQLMQGARCSTCKHALEIGYGW